MTPADSSLLEYFERLADLGAVLVIVGVAGEGIEIALKICKHKLKCESFLKWYDKYEFSIEIWGALFWIAVVVGLWMEFGYGHKAQLLVKKENSRITREAGEARKSAGIAILAAAQANERAANTESNNFMLKTKVLELEAKSRWRTITPEQEKAFVELTKTNLKLPIRVRMGNGSSAEVQSFSARIRAVLDKAGFEETNADQAITEWPPELNMLWTGMGPELPPIIFVSNPALPGKIIDLRDAQTKLKSYASYATNTFVKTEFAFVNDDSNPEASVRDENGAPVLHIKITDRAPFQITAFTAAQNAFNAIGIPSGYVTITNIPIGAFEVFVNPK